MSSAFLLSLALAMTPATEQSVSPQAERLTAIAPNIGELFPGATVLSDEDFTTTVVGRSFRYRDVSSGIVIVRPGEFFGEHHRYSFGHRAIRQGTYSIDGGVVSIDTPNDSFLGLGKRRIFFRHQGKIFTTGDNVGSSVLELIPNP